MATREQDLTLLDAITPTIQQSGPKGDYVRSLLQSLAKHVGPDQRLPSERTIAGYLGIARMTVQKEIDHLVSEGQLYRRPKSGTYPAPASNVINVDLLSSFSTTVTRRGARPGTVVLTATTELPTPSVAASLQMPSGSSVFLLSRIRTINDEPVAIEHTRLPMYLYPGIETVEWNDVSLFELLAERWGIEPESSKVEVSGLLPTPEQAQMLEITPHVPCLGINGLTHDVDGRVIEASESVFRADRYQLVVQAQRET